jgi:hypothetical protein
MTQPLADVLREDVFPEDFLRPRQEPLPGELRKLYREEGE